jgi:hypothetical protein
MPEKSEIVAALLGALKDAAPRPLSGSTLAVVLKARFADFEPAQFGSRNLRDFVRKYAAGEISEAGRAGMDVVYALPGECAPIAASGPPGERGGDAVPAGGRPGPLAQLINEPRVWKTFVSPSSPFRLFFAPEAGRIRLAYKGDEPRPGWREIPRIAESVLSTFARDFLATLPTNLQEQIAPTLSAPRWWIPFFEAIRAFGLERAWLEYRRGRITREFERVLAAHNIAPVEPGAAPAGTAIRAADALSASKRVALAVVQRMTDAEVRALSLPLGYVMDALNARS